MSFSGAIRQGGRPIRAQIYLFLPTPDFCERFAAAGRAGAYPSAAPVNLANGSVWDQKFDLPFTRVGSYMFLVTAREAPGGSYFFPLVSTSRDLNVQCLVAKPVVLDKDTVLDVDMPL